MICEIAENLFEARASVGIDTDDGRTSCEFGCVTCLACGWAGGGDRTPSYVATEAASRPRFSP